MLGYEDFKVTPDEAVAGKKKALENFTDVAQPALAKQQSAEKGQLASDVFTQTAKAAQMGQGQMTGSLVGQAEAKAAELLPAQATQQQNMNLQGAQMREDIVASRQQQAITNYTTTTEMKKAEAARALSQQAFASGMDAKELSLHQNGYLADAGLAQMYKDLQEGRTTKQEAQQLALGLKAEALDLKAQYDRDYQTLQLDLQVMLKNNDIRAMQARLEKSLKLQKEMAEAAAKASNMNAMVQGGFTIAGAVIGGVYGGPAGAAGGASLGSSASQIVPK